MLQLELAFFGSLTLREAIADFMARKTDDLAAGTIDDYRERAGWLLRELGEFRDITTITYDVLDNVCRRNRNVIRNVTIKKRLIFLIAVLKFARTRGLVERLPELPKLRNDGNPRQTVHTVEQWQVFREYLAPGRIRRFYDLGFWTLQHSSDLFTMRRSALDPDYRWLDEQGNEIGRGAYLRRNTKNRKCEPCWIPMQPEFALVARAMLQELPPLEGTLICGRIYNIHEALRMAADRAQAQGHDIPRVSPIDLRRSGASMLSSREYSYEFIRQALGHEGEDSHIQGGKSARPTTLARHYLRPTPDLMSQAFRGRKRGGGSGNDNGK